MHGCLEGCFARKFKVFIRDTSTVIYLYECVMNGIHTSLFMSIRKASGPLANIELHSSSDTALESTSVPRDGLYSYRRCW